MEDGERRSGVIRSFRDLEVYQLARREALKVFLLSKRFPPEERYSLTDQIRRASRAVAGMIAEAWAGWRRRHGLIQRWTVSTSIPRNTTGTTPPGNPSAPCSTA